MAHSHGPAMALRPEEEKAFEGQPKGFPFGDFDVMDVMLPEGDDMGIPSDSDEDKEGEEELQSESGFGNVLGEAPPRRRSLVGVAAAAARLRLRPAAGAAAGAACAATLCLLDMDARQIGHAASRRTQPSGRAAARRSPAAGGRSCVDRPASRAFHPLCTRSACRLLPQWWTTCRRCPPRSTRS